MTEQVQEFVIACEIVFIHPGSKPVVSIHRDRIGWHFMDADGYIIGFVNNEEVEHKIKTRKK